MSLLSTGHAIVWGNYEGWKGYAITFMCVHMQPSEMKQTKFDFQWYVLHMRLRSTLAKSDMFAGDIALSIKTKYHEGWFGWAFTLELVKLDRLGPVELWIQPSFRRSRRSPEIKIYYYLRFGTLPRGTPPPYMEESTGRGWRLWQPPAAQGNHCAALSQDVKTISASVYYLTVHKITRNI